MVIKHMKRCTVSFVIRELQITMWYTTTYRWEWLKKKKNPKYQLLGRTRVLFIILRKFPSIPSLLCFALFSFFFFFFLMWMAAEILLSVDSHAVVRKNIERSIFCSPNFPERCCLLSCVWLSATPWTVAHQAPLSMEFSRQEILEWVAISYSRRSSQPRDQTHIFCISGTGGWMDSLPLGHLGSLPSQCPLMVTVLKTLKRGFPGGSGVKNLPTNAGDSSLIPDSGRSCMPQSNSACWPQLLSPCAATTEARCPWACAPQQKKPLKQEACAMQWRVAPVHCNYRKACIATKTQHSQK